MTDEKLTIGFLGNGRSANRYHIPYLLVRKDKFRIKTICARSPENSAWKRLADVAYTADLDGVLNDPELGA